MNCKKEPCKACSALEGTVHPQYFTKEIMILFKSKMNGRVSTNLHDNHYPFSIINVFSRDHM